MTFTTSSLRLFLASVFSILCLTSGIISAQESVKVIAQNAGEIVFENSLFSVHKQANWANEYIHMSGTSHCVTSNEGTAYENKQSMLVAVTFPQKLNHN